jgi:hypothetical protein
VREETTVVGTPSRALPARRVVDLYLETGERALLDSALRQWDSLVATKSYLTGAVGSRFEGESFGDEYELPPDLVYGETCAAIAGVMVAWRLLLATGEAASPTPSNGRCTTSSRAPPRWRATRSSTTIPPSAGSPAGRADRHPARPGRGARHPAALVPVRMLPAQHHADRASLGAMWPPTPTTLCRCTSYLPATISVRSVARR